MKKYLLLIISFFFLFETCAYAENITDLSEIAKCIDGDYAYDSNNNIVCTKGLTKEYQLLEIAKSGEFTTKQIQLGAVKSIEASYFVDNSVSCKS